MIKLVRKENGQTIQEIRPTHTGFRPEPPRPKYRRTGRPENLKKADWMNKPETLEQIKEYPPTATGT